MTVYFSEGHHFGHANIIKYASRPYSSIEEMDAALVANWNSVVSPGDTVYYLGDFCLGDANQARKYLAQLNGQIQILDTDTHHDKRWIKQIKLFSNGLVTAQGESLILLPALSVLKFEKQWFVLCHFPFASWEGRLHGWIHLHGHCHGRYHGEGKIMDVGVDANNFYPVSEKRVLEYCADRPVFVSHP